MTAISLFKKNARTCSITEYGQRHTGNRTKKKFGFYQINK